jgi:hypothetical protein
MRKSLLVFSFFILQFHLQAQTIAVEPYLQDAEPDRITIMWETATDNSTSVDYGLTVSLGTVVSGTAITGSGTSYIHTTNLTGLTPATRYFYKVITGPTESAIYEFITPALPSAETGTNIMAMSDMQQDWTNPTIWGQIIQNGVLQYINDSVGTDLPANLQMVIIPGDLVDNGNNYAEWENTFFDPAHPIFAYVPVYPVLGNHEQNTTSYFKYFTLPNNGTGGFEEHWWYKDHSNVRIIGLNSNSPYDLLPQQINWLQSTLDSAAVDPDIDFVFVQLHHPWHSELWPPGESGYTGTVVGMLETFSTNTGKPTIHFFGHTHAYSRGESRDHNHLMVNVATAGGNIDFWGEYAQIDYPEFIQSVDEYGFVYVEVEAGANPKFTLKRFNMGDGTTLDPYTLEDLVTIKKNNNAPITPVGLFPAMNDVVNPDCLILKANDFMDADNDGFGAAQWQISTSCADFSTPIIDSWNQYQNSFNEVDLQASDDLTDEAVTNLLPSTTYCWRVRYRDKSLGWSAWSNPITFSTGTSSETANLLTNNGAEGGTTGWTTTAGALEALMAGECNGTTPYAGSKYFAVGALCTENAFGSANQVVDVSAYAAQIDAGDAIAKFGGYLRDYNGTDIPAFAMQFLDGSSTLISGTDTTQDVNANWMPNQDNWAVPAGTRNIRFIIMGTRTSGADNDSYLDELFLKLNLNGDSCSQFDITAGMEPSKETQQLLVYPNPVTTSAIVNIPNTEGEHLVAKLYNTSGNVVKEMHHIHGPTFTINRGEMAAGLYFLVIYKDDKQIGYAKVIMR